MKRVSFDETIYIFFIDNRECLLQTVPKQYLWWSEIDYYNFRNNSIEDAMFLMHFFDVFNEDD